MNSFQPLPHDTLSKYSLTDSPFFVTSDAIYQKHSSLNPTKVHGPDGITTWLLKENADLLDDPVKDILNCSYVPFYLRSYVPTYRRTDVFTETVERSRYYPGPKEKNNV
jgi:hypothetical protein